MRAKEFITETTKARSIGIRYYRDLYKRFKRLGYLDTPEGEKIQKEAEKTVGDLGEDAVKFYWVSRYGDEHDPAKAEFITRIYSEEFLSGDY